MLRAVFLSLEPTAQTMLRWNQKRKQSKDIPIQLGFGVESLSLFDQFFLFLCRVKEGAFEESLADRFQVSQSTVSRVLITWTNYLFFYVWFIKCVAPQIKC